MGQPKLVWVARLILTLELFILIPALVVSSQQPLIHYCGDFSNATSMVWNTSNSPSARKWINDGRYHILVECPDYQTCVVANGPQFANFRLDVDTFVGSCPADNEYGILFRFAQGDSCYAFTISADGYVKLSKRLNGAWLTLVPRKRCYMVNLGQASNHLTVVANGCLLSCYVNGGKVIEVTDDSCACGRIGLVAVANQYPGFQIAFDNVTVRSLAR